MKDRKIIDLDVAILISQVNEGIKIGLSMGWTSNGLGSFQALLWEPNVGLFLGLAYINRPHDWPVQIMASLSVAKA